jgi:cytochrome oxidase Cu insertion factor (SCO1/SenC/PrrC family)
MTGDTPRPPRTIWVGFLLFFALFALAFLMWVTQAMRNFGEMPLRVIGPVADFALTNQDGRLTTLADFTNHVWVADIIFTRCAGPCPRMTGQMRSQRTAQPNWSRSLPTRTTIRRKS